MRSEDDLLDLLAHRSVGNTLTLTVTRGSAELTLYLVLGPYPSGG
jgi:hypothetical protein